ncbi:MAG: dihydrolipoyl dehydrogenase family protein [Dehalococcoidia bacterium]
MATFDYDLAIVGGGSAGLTAAKVGRFFAQKRIAMIDKQRLGGDCLYYGCVPSKALIKSARVAHEVEHAGKFGLAPAKLAATLGAVNGKVQFAIGEVAKIDSEEHLRESGVDLFLGGGRFSDPNTIETGDGGKRVSAKYVLIGTGSHPATPRLSGIEETGYVTNEDVFSLQDLPQRLAVVGGGPIGCELAQALARLGSHVTLLQKGPHLLPRDDADMIAILEPAFAAEGIEVLYDTGVEAARKDGTDKVLTLSGQHAGELRVDEILVAVGRTPNVEGMNLEAAGVKYGPRGIEVNERLQTNVEHIYAAGDVVGGMQFTHYAGYQAAQAVRNIFLPVKQKFNAGNVPWVTFTDPEIGHVGLTEDEARKAGKPFSVVKFPYSALERAITDQDSVGLMKFLIDGKRRFVGCHVAGANAGELINELTLAMNNDLTVDAVIGSIHAYPTYSFGIPVALYDYVLNEHPQAIARFGRFLSKFT